MGGLKCCLGFCDGDGVGISQVFFGWCEVLLGMWSTSSLSAQSSLGFFMRHVEGKFVGVPV